MFMSSLGPGHVAEMAVPQLVNGSNVFYIRANANSTTRRGAEDVVGCKSWHAQFKDL